jgi:hypothetical protein
MSNATCVQAPELLHAFRTVASCFVPPGLRICIWTWSFATVSVQNGAYQNESVGEPEGTVTDCLKTLFPLNADGEPALAA